MKKRNLLMITLLAGSLLASGASFARPDGCDGHHEGHRDRMEHMMKELKLSDKQVEAIRAIKQAQRKDMRSSMMQMKKIRMEMREQVQSENYDAAKVRQLADAKATIMANMTVEHIKTMREIRSQLTPDQIKKMDTMIKHHRHERDDEHDD